MGHFLILGLGEGRFRSHSEQGTRGLPQPSVRITTRMRLPFRKERAASQKSLFLLPVLLFPLPYLPMSPRVLGSQSSEVCARFAGCEFADAPPPPPPPPPAGGGGGGAEGGGVHQLLRGVAARGEPFGLSPSGLAMLVLFETAAGYAIFKVLNEKKLQEVDSLWKEFETPEKANKIVKLKHFEKFQDTTEALAASTALVEGKLSKNLKKVLKKIAAKEAHEQLAVADAKLGGVIKDKLNLSCIHSPTITELMRGIRSQIEGLITGLPSREMAAMCLGLAHSLSRYKLKFSADKVDTMIVQAISLLDDLDKELNNYIMRCREWYGWHFPELGKIITDNLTYCKCLRKVGDRQNFASSDLSEILSEEVEAEVKAAAEISMGTEVSEEDINNILHLCNQVIEISEYRNQLYEYLQNRMMAIAPNVTVMVGELVGARLISHAGSLLNLAKHAASTVQILGAEKALFRALKTRRDTPKYGLIYHASLVGQSTPKNKGKISRMLAAKTALAIRYDAFGEDSSAEMGIENRAKLEARLRHLEERGIRKISGTGKALAKTEKYFHKSEIKTYDPSGDSTLPTLPKKRKFQEVSEEQEEELMVEVKAKKPKIIEVKEEDEEVEVDSAKKKKKKDKKEKKKKIKEEIPSEEEPSTSIVIESPEKKKKKKKKKETAEQ
uniref:Nucleolar protein 58 n=2 Tax=Sarcophilus harrisii TaxID=9305 RepID=G3WD26_SARHA